MLYFSRTKVAVTLVTLTLSLLIIVLTNGLHLKYFRGIKLGLDLSGGSSLVLQPDLSVLKTDYYKQARDDIVSALDNSHLDHNTLHQLANNFYLKLSNLDERKRFTKALGKINEGLVVGSKAGMTLIKVDQSSYLRRTSDVLNQSIEIIRRRVDEFGTNEPTIKIQGQSIVVELPGVKDTANIKRIIGRTARISFHLVDTTATFNHSATIPFGYKYMYAPNHKIRYAISIEDKLTGKNLKKASLSFNQNNQPVVAFSFDREGSQKFADLTSHNVGHMLAIVLDNQVISAPVINTPIVGGNGIIEGKFTLSDAQDLALLLQAGSLPVPLAVTQENTVGPTLGLQSIKNGLYSALGGMALVFLYMIVFYRKLGAIAVVSLIFNMVLTVALLSILGCTLTLPGIAGLILGIGMAVDSNILVYERYNYEIRSARAAIAMHNSFQKVYQTLLDSNLTTLFAALFLFYFGSGPVKGFGVTLIVGIVASLFSIFLTTRLLVNWFYLRAHN